MRRQLLTGLLTTICLLVILCGVYPLVVWGIGQVALSHQADGSLVSSHGRVVGSSLLGQSFADKRGNPLPQYFQPRPSATSPTSYNAGASSGSNLGPSNPALVGFQPWFNTVDLDGNPSKTNPFATPQDPFCVPTDPDGNAVPYPSAGQKYAKTATGQYVCYPNTVPQRAISYRKLNGLSPTASVPVDAVTASGSGLDPQISAANARLQAPRVARRRRLSLKQVDQLIDQHTDGRSLGFLGDPGVNVLELNLALDRLTGS
jgi:potassium-transporting ATPase KdpC subunit